MKLYNSLSQKIETFKPLKEKEVSMYVCGITPYDTTHIGHAFVYVFFDTLQRFFLSQGKKINYTENVTDIDDDILKRAKETNQDWRELGTFWTNRFLADMKNLHVLPVTHYVKATDAISEIIGLIQKLVEKKNAYIVNGTVYFDNETFPSYGSLSKYTPKEMIALSKERGADPDDPQKKHPLDFILWQKGKGGEPMWDSPYGKGRPGWHIECSSMITQTLGDQIDIHGGGFDLIYPHHESERAQSESATGKSPFVGYWMEVAMVYYEKEKMSKSLGNLVMVSDLIKKYPYGSIRYVLLTHHYRTPWEFSMKELDEADKTLTRLKKDMSSLPEGKSKETYTLTQIFISHLENDMDTPSALKELLAYVKNNPKDTTQSEVKELLNVVGIELK